LGVILRVLITGSNGFIGKNLKARLKEFKDIEIVTFNRQDELSSLSSKLINIDYVFHFASINRSENDNDFIAVNVNLVNLITDKLIEIKENSGKSIPLIFTSSTQVNLDNIYGNTKKNAESILKAMSISFDIPIYIFRLPNVFGKWCKPNYNSVVSTFCHNIANDLPITINDPDAEITLLYIDDLIESFLKIIHTRPLNRDLSRINYTNNKNYLVDLPKTESISIKSLASIIYSFKEMRLNLMVGKVGTGLTRALYSTYISYFNKI
jgi:UDP-2-acetamido-2,6-beta-L-arabino-hexul-4-ose reductase